MGAIIAATGGYAEGSPAYHYDLRGMDKDKKFFEFNMEQQADLIAHYFAARFLKTKKYVEEYIDLKRVLAPFLQDPEDPSLLPITTNFLGFV